MIGPELVRFYGGTPQQWETLPWPLARRYYEAIPRVRAREAGQPAAAQLTAAPPLATPLATAPPAPKRQPTVAELRQRLPEFGIGMGA